MLNLSRFWGKLPPGGKRLVFVACLAGVLVTAFLAFTPEPKKFGRGGPQSFEHLLTDEDTSKVTLQNIAAKMDNLRSDQTKMQRQIDSLYSDAKKSDTSKDDRIMQKEMATMLAKLKDVERKADITQKRVDGLEDTGLTVSQDAIEKAVKGVAQDAMKNGAGANPFPVMPMSSVTPRPIPQGQGNSESGTVVLPNNNVEVAAPDSVETTFSVHKNAGDFFKSADVPNSSSLPGRTGAAGTVGASGTGKSGRTLVGRTISSGDVKSSSIEAKSQEVARQRELEANEGKEDEDKVYIPTGSIVEAVVISGMDAPTAKAAKDNPFPSLLRVKKEAILPNYFTADLRECFILASGYGDLSSSRAYMRAEALSCVRNDGGVVESRFDGFASGDDGKAGIRGRLVSREGQLIGKALLAGFAEGISKALDVTAVPTLSTSDSDSIQYQQILSDETIQSGVMGGASNAAGKIADYWLEMADQIYPIIEISAGRNVSFIVTSGFELSLKSGKRDS